MRIHKTHITAGDWSHEIPDGEMSLDVHDGITYGILQKNYYLDTKGQKVRWTRDGQRELFVVVRNEAFAVTHLVGDETLENRLSMNFVDGKTVHQGVKEQFVEGSPLARKLESLGLELPLANGRTARGYPGAPHLFMPRFFGPYTISLQGSRGHSSKPKTNLDYLEDYEAVEAVIYGPGGKAPGMLHPSELGLVDEDICRCFGQPPESDSDTPVGVFLSWDMIHRLETHLAKVAAEPAEPENEGPSPIR